MPRLLSSRTAAAGAVVAALVGLLTLIAVAGRAGRGSTSTSGEEFTLPGSVVDFAFTLALIAAAAGPLVVALVVRGGPKRRLGNPLTRSLVQLATIVIIGVVFWQALEHAKRAQPPETDEVPPGLLETIPTATNPTVTDGGAPGASGLHFSWEAAATAGGLAAAGIAAVLLMRRRRGAAVPEQSLPERVAHVIDDTLDDLRREPDPRRAVIAAYARAEHGLAAAGAPRRPAEAPLEYLSRVLRELRVRPAAVLDLTELFERAKFSAHTIDAAMKSAAIAALVTVREDLRP